MEITIEIMKVEEEAEVVFAAIEAIKVVDIEDLEEVDKDVAAVEEVEDSEDKKEDMGNIIDIETVIDLIRENSVMIDHHLVIINGEIIAHLSSKILVKIGRAIIFGEIMVEVDKKKSLKGNHPLERIVTIIVKVEEITSGVKKNLQVGDKYVTPILIEN